MLHQRQPQKINTRRQGPSAILQITNTVNLAAHIRGFRGYPNTIPTHFIRHIHPAFGSAIQFPRWCPQAVTNIGLHFFSARRCFHRFSALDCDMFYSPAADRFSGSSAVQYLAASDKHKRGVCVTKSLDASDTNTDSAGVFRRLTVTPWLLIALNRF